MGDDAVREGQRAVWAELAHGWETWDSVIMGQLAPVTAVMVEQLRLADEQHHLDVASGTGEPGLTVARLAPRGRVVLTDLSAPMLDVARRRADAAGLANIVTAVCSADELPYADGAFDSVSVRFGLMFVPDPASAMAELVRVLRPGGRLSASVWVRPDDNPWTSIVMSAIGAETPLPPPDPDAPSMFRCAAPGRLRDLLEGAGLREVEERDVEVVLATSTPEEYWQVMSEHVSLAVRALRSADDAARERIAAAVRSDVQRYAVDGAVRVPGAASCAAGTA